MAMLILLFNGRARDNVTSVERTEAKENKKAFLGLSCNIQLETQQTCQLSKEANYLLSPYNDNN